jgi:hypothetical protein
MHRHHFDVLTRALPARPSRRHLVGLVGAILGLRTGSHASARKKRRRKKKHQRKIARNAFGCVSVGDYCTRDTQCCSGICAGKKGKQACQAHDADICQGQNFCLAEIENCTTTDGGDGQCAVTTGDASFCMTDAYCLDCATDADCIPVCGTEAACIVCPKCGMSQFNTACAGLYDNACFLT